MPINHRVLRAWRYADGRKPEQICVAADISFPYLRRLEDGTASNPTASVLARLAAAYGRDVGELFTADPAPDPAGAR